MMWTRRGGRLGLALGLAVAAPAAAAGTDFDCLIQPRETVAISSPVPGYIERVAVDRGDLVREGTVVVQLESSLERATVAVARARIEQESAMKSSRVRLEFGVRRYDRTIDMYKKELVPLKEMDEAETAKILAEYGVLEVQENMRVARLELERAEAALMLRTIRSPFTGLVTDRLLSPGELVDKAPILKLARIDPLRVEVFVPVAMLGRIGVGSRATVIPEAPVNTPQEASVTVVDRIVDAASGTFGVRLEMPNPDNRLPAGLKCKARFGAGGREGERRGR
jgi:RND family efflux transporter MFP subunit